HEAAATRSALLKYYYAGFDEETRLSYLAEIESEFARYYSMVVAHGQPDDYAILHQFHLTTKGLILEFSSDIRRQIDDASLPDFKAWQLLRDSISAVLVMDRNQRASQNIVLETMLSEAKALEKRWTRSANVDGRSGKIAWDLAAEEVAIDFFRCSWFGHGDSLLYGAFLTRPDDTIPDIVTFGMEHEFEDALSQGFFPLEFSDQEEAFTNLLLLPLYPYLDTFERLLISPSGILHQIPFNALRYRGHYLAESHEVVVRPDFRSSYEPGRGLDLGQGLVVADLTYGVGDRKPFFPLPGAAAELDLIQSIAPTLEVVSDAAAKRSSLMSLISVQQPTFIHFATHGFNFAFNAEPGNALSDALTRISNPLARTGLVLSNVNDYWSQPHTEGASQVLLSAYDIANLSLAQTELVFLSGCESGIGDLHTSEGVFGLPRSFLLAGARSIVYTIWQIDDHRTAQFVRTFYENVSAGKRISEAFAETQRSMMHLHPFYWAGFVLVER
nr:CHAT domain-containing protein [Saprospiraceae bacterium]